MGGEPGRANRTCQAKCGGEALLVPIGGPSFTHDTNVLPPRSTTIVQAFHLSAQAHSGHLWSAFLEANHRFCAAALNFESRLRGCTELVNCL